MDILDEFNNQSRTLLVKMYDIKHLKVPQEFLKYQEKDLKERMGNDLNIKNAIGALSGSLIDKRIVNYLYHLYSCGLIFNDEKVHVFNSLVQDGYICNSNINLTKSIQEDNKLYIEHGYGNTKTRVRDKISSMTKPTRPTDNQTIFKATLQHQVKHTSKEENSTKPLQYTEQVFLPTTTFNESVVGVMLDLRGYSRFVNDIEASQSANTMHSDELNTLTAFANELNVKLFIRYMKQDNTTGLMEYKN